MTKTASEIAERLLAVEAERARLMDELAAAEEQEEAEQPKELKRFRHTVRAYGTFVSTAYDAYEADEQAREMRVSDILTCVQHNGGWQDMEVNDDELPEEL
jgi:hypothetical protein